MPSAHLVICFLACSALKMFPHWAWPFRRVLYLVPRWSPVWGNLVFPHQTLLCFNIFQPNPSCINFLVPDWGTNETMSALVAYRWAASEALLCKWNAVISVWLEHDWTHKVDLTILNLVPMFNDGFQFMCVYKYIHTHIYVGIYIQQILIIWSTTFAYSRENVKNQ